MQSAPEKSTPLVFLEIPQPEIVVTLRPTPLGWLAGPELTVTMTAYNSLPEQTCGSSCSSPDDPFITATGTWVRPGVVAVSRDLRDGLVPYGSAVQVLEVHDHLTGCSGWLPGVLLDVQDTMAARKRNQLDLWLESRDAALAWGRCTAVVQVLYPEVE